MRYASPITNEPSKRKDGFVSACVEMGLPFEVMALEDGQPFSEFEHFLRSHVENGKFAFDGLFIGTDYLAWQIIGLLRSMNMPQNTYGVISRGPDFLIPMVIPFSLLSY